MPPPIPNVARKVRPTPTVSRNTPRVTATPRPMPGRPAFAYLPAQACRRARSAELPTNSTMAARRSAAA